MDRAATRWPDASRLRQPSHESSHLHEGEWVSAKQRVRGSRRPRRYGLGRDPQWWCQQAQRRANRYLHDRKRAGFEYCCFNYRNARRRGVVRYSEWIERVVTRALDDLRGTRWLTFK